MPDCPPAFSPLAMLRFSRYFPFDVIFTPFVEVSMFAVTISSMSRLPTSFERQRHIIFFFFF